MTDYKPKRRPEYLIGSVLLFLHIPIVIDRTIILFIGTIVFALLYIYDTD